MPRDGNGVATKPAGTTATPNQLIESSKFNSVIDDIYTDMNAARPITAGGTGATTKQGAVSALFDGTTIVDDDNFTLAANGDQTKLLSFDLSGLTTGEERTLTVPDASTTLVGTDTTDTLTNKTLTDGVKVKGSGSGVGTAIISFRDALDTQLGYVGAASGANAQFAVISSSANVNVTSLNASGVINIGTTIPADTSTAGVSVYKSGSSGGHTLYAINASNGSAMVVGTVSASAGTVVSFFKGASACGSISATTTTTAYNTTSDANLKENFEEFDAGAIIDGIGVWKYQFKSNGEVGYGPKAQELYEVFPSAVTPGVGLPGDDDYVPWVYDASKLVPVLLSEVKALRQRVLALENHNKETN